MNIAIDDLNPDLRLGVQAYSSLAADKGPGAYAFGDFADIINARYDSPNAHAIADAFRAVPDGVLTINPNRTASVDLPDARAMALQQDAQTGAKKEPAPDKAPPRDFRQEFTDKVIAAIESGQALPWDRPWHAMQGLPRNAASGKTYAGGNRVVLGLVAMEKGYTDPRWMTVKQSNDLGGFVRKGEKGVMIERWDNKPFWTRKDVELKLGVRPVVVDAKRGVDAAGVHLLGGQVVPAGQITVKHGGKDYTWKQAERALDLLVGRNYVVFNAEQCEGLKLEPLTPRQDVAIDKRGEQLMAAMQEDGVRFVHGGSRAYYSPAGDLIALPQRDTFKSLEGYYGTALHEMGHATGAEKRLNRDGITGGNAFGSEGYAREELRAELFSAFMAAETGIPHDEEKHKAYIQSWAKALKQDKNEIFRAASEAGKAVDYVLAKEQSLQMTQERQASAKAAALAADAKPVPTMREALEQDGWKATPWDSYEKTFILEKDKRKGGEFTRGAAEVERILTVKTNLPFGFVIAKGWDDIPIPVPYGTSPPDAVRLLDAEAKDLLAREHADLGVTAVRGQNEPAPADPQPGQRSPAILDAIRREDELLSKEPHELTFDEFSTVARVQKLGPNHGRQWEVFNGKESLGFADGPTEEGALRQVHEREVNNALYGNQPDSPDFLRKSMPPQQVLAEYPGLQKLWARVIDAHQPAAATPDAAQPPEPTQSKRAETGTQKTSVYDQAIQNFVKFGGIEKDGRAILDDELLATHPKNLPSALAFHRFARPEMAEHMAAAIVAEENQKMLDKEDRKATDLGWNGSTFDGGQGREKGAAGKTDPEKTPESAEPNKPERPARPRLRQTSRKSAAMER